MTVNEFKELHKNCNLTMGMLRFGPNHDKFDIYCEVHNEIFYEASAPYPFCWDKINCAGNGYCKKSIACNN